jgi:hypothetical protein
MFKYRDLTYHILRSPELNFMVMPSILGCQVSSRPKCTCPAKCQPNLKISQTKGKEVKNMRYINRVNAVLGCCDSPDMEGNCE